MTTATLVDGSFAFKAHPAAELFPLLDTQDLNELAADIRAHGLLHPVVLHNGEILDGRNRLAACLLAGVTPTFDFWEGDSPTDYVLSTNLHRRHLNGGQRAMIATQVRALYEEEARAAQARGKSDLAPKVEQGRRAHETAGRAAEQVGVSKAYVYEADRLKSASPELASSVREGKVSLRAASRLVAAGEIERPKPEPRRGLRRDKDAAWDISSDRKRQIAEGQRSRLSDGLAQINGVCRGLRDIDYGMVGAVSTAKELAIWANRAEELSRVLRDIKAKLDGGK